MSSEPKASPKFDPSIRSSHVETQARIFLEQFEAALTTPLHELPIQTARAMLEGAQANPPSVPAKIKSLEIPFKDGKTISLRIVTPESAENQLPAVLYFHGGGWILGSEKTHDLIVRLIANGAKASVVFVNYTPSPEAQYPQPIEEAYAALEWVAKKGDQMGLDPLKIAVAGDSVGGNMAIAVTLMAKERKGPKIRQQILLCPVTNASFDTHSYQQFREGYSLTKAAMEWFWENYAPNAQTRTEILASPLNASLTALKDLPPALILTAENDVLRDEGEAYAHKLMEAGVNVTATRYLGTIHDFMMLNALADTSAAQEALRQINETLRRAFKEPQ